MQKRGKNAQSLSILACIIPPFPSFLRTFALKKPPRGDNGQRTTDNGQWTTDNGQRTMDNGQWTMDNGQRTMDNGQWTTDNGQW